MPTIVLTSLKSFPRFDAAWFAEKAKAFENVVFWDDEPFCPMCNMMGRGHRNFKVCDECKLIDEFKL